jgi:uncharacterized coiled-coil protein SlyX
MSDKERLEALETRCTFLERSVQELSDTMYQQQRELEKLLVTQKELLTRLAQSDPGTGASADGIELPPHY